MAKCACCKHIKVNVMSYGNESLCSVCMNKYNPKTRTVMRLTDSQVESLRNEIIELESKIRSIKHDLNVNYQLFNDNEQTVQKIINGYWVY